MSTDHYLYLDETGTLDFEDRPGEAYFGIGTAHWLGDHRDAIWDGHQIRVELEAKGVRLPKGLHAKNDSASTRVEVYNLIAQQKPRIDVTMLYKSHAYDSVRSGGKVRLYKTALWLHLKFLIPAVSSAGDRVFVIAGQLQTNNRRDAIRHAVDEVCQQLGYNREVVSCIWDAPTAWGIQVADYALWRVQRRLEGKSVPSYTEVIDDFIATQFTPWRTK